MRTLITGGAGFIGSHLSERLLKDGHEVLVLDDLSTGSLSNIEHLIGVSGFDHHVGSVCDQPLVEDLVDRTDVTVHLAAAVGVRLIVEHPVHTIETNVHGTDVVLRAVARKKKTILLASTSEVYGKRSEVPFSESDDLVLGPTTHSRWAYACSKALDEWLGLAYFNEFGVPVIVARLFNTVGPRQTGRYGMVLPTFAQQALRQEPITVFGSGEQSRCFAHVTDVVAAMVRLLHSTETVGQVFNIGSNREVTMNRLAAMVKEAAHSTSPITHLPYDQAYAAGFEDMQRRIPDTQKLEETVGFVLTRSLESIIEDVLEHARASISALP
jgi:UDP-glucose 4-epimerase